VGHWEDIRRKARTYRADALVQSGGEESAAALLTAAESLTGVRRISVKKGDVLLDGGVAVLDREAGIIWYDRDANPQLAAFYQAHEYGHFWLDEGQAACNATEIDAEEYEEPLPLGERRVEGYGPEEMREREANVFAREFLLPTDALKNWYLAEGLDATAIADRVGVPEGMVLHQLTRALLTPEISGEEAAEEAPEGEPDLDPSQREAAQVEHGPLLLGAGPGTGKTRALVGRILFLLEEGVPPSSILALTFSNKAAEEMRSRIARVAPDAASRIWVGTFHAFGLEILRKYGAHLGLPPKPAVVDPVEGLFLLERSLPDLGLRHYQNLYEPTTHLGDILSAISRAKDELVGPEEYAALAEQMLAGATTEKETLAAEKALEVARVYALYQEHLGAHGMLDFGDLIVRSVCLLRQHKEIRRLLRRTYEHVLVDEYQDVNRASGLLLKELAGDGEGLWAVGDVRQAIYRFRGASPSNVRFFLEDFPDAAVHALEHNYRSVPAVLDVFAELAPDMRAARGAAFVAWRPKRQQDGEVLMEVAEDGDSEIEGLAQEMKRQRGLGVAYADQAVLCRSHTNLARIAAGLEREGVPVMYLGDLFERPEVRDLLALLALACEGDGRGLLRVARFAEYSVPLADVRSLLDMSKEREIPFPRALKLARDSDTISAQGKAGLALLDSHLEGLCFGSNAWGMLARYLFVRSAYVRGPLGEESVAGQQRRLAVYQFLQFAHAQRDLPVSGGEDPKRAFLRYVRRLEMFGEEKQLRQMPDWAGDLDAVRLLTVHASKGLEFSSVYLPVLGNGRFPAKRRYRPCPPPTGMLRADEENWHEEEEECLFFVALSRARDRLCLSRARRYFTQNSKPSPLLARIATLLPNPPNGEITWGREEVIREDPGAALPAGVLPSFSSEELETYMSCPRKYYYEFVLELGRRQDGSAYVDFHRCVYELLRWVQEELASGRQVEDAAALLRFAEIWEERGPTNHPYEGLYRRNAEDMVTRALSHPVLSSGASARPEWEIELEHGRVRLRPDHVGEPEDEAGGQPVVRRLRTGRSTKSERDKPVYGLYQKAADLAYPRHEPRLERAYLSTGEVEDTRMEPDTVEGRVKKYDDAMAGIRREQFAPKPDDRECPRCPHYFICPAAEDE
jgi:DNA helicase-2/ATP-dependent DNA helicase PcrA